MPTRRSVKGSQSSRAHASVPAANASATNAANAANTTGARSAASVTNAASAANAANTANAANKSEKMVPEVLNGTSAAHTVEEKLVSGGKPAFRYSPAKADSAQVAPINRQCGEAFVSASGQHKDASAPADKQRREASPQKTATPQERSAQLSGQTRKKAGKKKQKHHSPLRILLIIAGSIFTLFIIACIALGVHRWCIYDDAQDIQGTWYIYNTKATVPIGQSTIGLSEDTEYNYTIDTQAKTITYSIGNLSGTSHYRFSLDRTQIALIEDGEKVFTATLFDDLSWWASSLSDYLSGKSVLPANESSNVVILTRAESSSDEQEESDAGESAGETTGEAAGETTGEAADTTDVANTAVQGEGASEASDTNS